MPVLFTDKEDFTCYLVPAPMVTISREYDRTGDGAIIGVRYPITLNGTLVAHMGSPDYSGDFSFGVTANKPEEWNKDDSSNVSQEKWMYRAIQNKQMALRKLFSHHNEGGEFEFQALDDAGFKCNPRILNIAFAQEPAQANIMTYTIQLEADEIQGPAEADGTDNSATGGGAAEGKVIKGLDVDPEGRGANDLDGVNSPFFKYKVKSASENWSMDEQEGKSIHYEDVTDSEDPDHKRYRHVTEKADPADPTLSGFKELSVSEHKVKVDLADGGNTAAQDEIKK